MSAGNIPKLLLMFYLALGPSLAAHSEEQLFYDMSRMQKEIQTDKKQFIANNMQLTPTEAESFWSLHESYEKDFERLNARSLKLIEEYAASFQSLSDEEAKRLLNDYLVIERDRQKTREYYVGKFRSIISARQVARFYQLENKIQALVNYDLATRIPLVK